MLALCFISVVVLASISSHTVHTELERELAMAWESLAQAGGARDELGAVMSRVAQEIEVTLGPNASSTEHLAALMAAGQK